MKIIFFYADLKDREINLLKALSKGAAKHGDTVEGVPTSQYSLRRDADVAGIFGVKGNSRVLLSQYSKVGIQTLYIDKGYTRCCPRGRDYYKLVVDGFNRDDLGTLDLPKDRFSRLGGDLKNYIESSSDAPIVITGSSAKFHEFAGLVEPTAFIKDLYKKLSKKTSRPIIYRPKPSWRGAEEISGMKFSRPPETLQQLFAQKPHVLITYGSNAGVDALFAGVPVISLNELCVTHNISSHTIEDITEPYIPSKKERFKWLCDLAYQQWTIEEMESGEAWEHIRRSIRP